MNKRAGIIDLQINNLLAITFIIISMITMIAYIRQETSSQRFTKEYLSKDLALFIETIYASPNDLKTAYPQNESDFNYSISEGEVCVMDHAGKKCSPFAESAITTIGYGEFFPSEDIDIGQAIGGRDDDVALVFLKKGNEILPRFGIVDFEIWER